MELVIETPPKRDIHHRPDGRPENIEQDEQIRFENPVKPVLKTFPIQEEVTPRHDEPEQSPVIKRSHKSFGLALAIVTVTYVLKWLMSSVLV